MADIQNATSNVTLWDELGNVVGVTLNSTTGLYELNVKIDSDGNNVVHTQNPWQHWTQEGGGFGYRRLFTTTSGTAETDFLLLRNPVGSGKTMYAHSIEYTYTKGSGVSLCRIYAMSTVTSPGTLETIFKLKPTSATTSVGSMYYAPTISARGNQFAMFGQGATGTFIYEPDLGFFLEPGYDMLFTITPAANNTDHSISMYWVEF